jgi:hypothetical protein
VTTAEKYVVAAYSVFLVTLLVYLAIHSLRLARLDRELAELTELARGRPAGPEKQVAVG